MSESSTTVASLTVKIVFSEKHLLQYNSSLTNHKEGHSSVATYLGCFFGQGQKIFL